MPHVITFTTVSNSRMCTMLAITRSLCLLCFVHGVKSASLCIDGLQIDWQPDTTSALTVFHTGDVFMM